LTVSEVIISPTATSLDHAYDLRKSPIFYTTRLTVEEIGRRSAIQVSVAVGLVVHSCVEQGSDVLKKMEEGSLATSSKQPFRPLHKPPQFVWHCKTTSQPIGGE
jgi:hypothetical protein